MSAPKASCYSTLVKSKLALDIVWSSAMRRFPTVLVLQASSLLTALGTLEKLMPARGSLGDDIVEQIRQQLLPLKELCTQLGLRVCEEHTKEILQRLQAMQLSEFTRASMELKNNLQRELNGMVCLWLPADKEGYFQKTSLFGAEVSKAFPSSSFDIEEAGMCIALSRGTACVFHLMRVMEVGLRSFARNLGISVPDDKNWGHILREISAATTRLPDFVLALLLICRVSRRPGGIPLCMYGGPTQVIKLKISSPMFVRSYVSWQQGFKSSKWCCRLQPVVARCAPSSSPSAGRL